MHREDIEGLIIEIEMLKIVLHLVRGRVEADKILVPLGKLNSTSITTGVETIRG